MLIFFEFDTPGDVIPNQVWDNIPRNSIITLQIREIFILLKFLGQQTNQFWDDKPRGVKITVQNVRLLCLLRWVRAKINEFKICNVEQASKAQVA